MTCLSLPAPLAYVKIACFLLILWFYQPTVVVGQALANGLVVYYPFDGNANDASTNGNHGTATGGLTYTTDRTGTANKAANFDGIDDWVDTPYTQSSLTGFTVSVWVKTDLGIIPSGVNPSAIIQNRNTNNGSSLTLDYDRSDGAWEFGLDGNFTKIVKRIVYPNLNGWLHLTGVWSGAGNSIATGQFKVYINGVLQTTTAVTAGAGSIPFTSVGTLKIGYHQPWNTYFRGSLDDLRIYNRALSDTEIQALYDTENIVPPLYIYSLNIPTEVRQGENANVLIKATVTRQ